MFKRWKKDIFVAEKKKKMLIKFTTENSVHHQKKTLSLKCAINDALIGSQSDK